VESDLATRPEAVLSHPSAPADFEAFFRANYRLLARSLQPVSEYAEDSVQRAFANALRNWDVVRATDSPSAWLRRAAVSNLREMYRTRANEPAKAPLDALRPDGSPTIRILPKLETALARLPVRQRLAMTLFYIADLSVNDVADAMGISKRGVRSALRSGRQGVKHLLRALDGPD
jgi:RNA polymerase sigma-70 factor, ECF subfamily